MAPQHKSYHDDDVVWNDEGQRFGRELGQILAPLIEREFAAGFHPSEIMDMIVSEMQSTLCMLRIKRRCAPKSKETIIIDTDN